MSPLPSTRPAIRRPPSREDAGAAAVLGMLFVLILCLLLGLVINVGRIFRTRGDLQHAADSAALAAVEELTGAVDPTVEPYNAAVAFAAKFQLTNSYRLQGSNVDVTYGFWHMSSGDNCVFGAGTCAAGWEAAPSGSYRWFLANAAKATIRYPLPPIMGGLMEQGNMPLAASALAVSRRANVSCSLPVGVPSCRILDANGALRCPFQTWTFTAGVEASASTSTPSYTLPETNGNTVVRLDLARGQAPISDDTDGFMRSRVRSRTFDNDLDCSTWGLDYPVGPAPVPAMGAAVSNGATTGKVVIQPLIEGVLGDSAAFDLSNPLAQHQVAGKCKLGQKLVVAVVEPAGHCGTWPPAAYTDWPPGGSAMVIGYVNIVFTSVRCASGETITAANCESDNFLASHCGHRRLASEGAAADDNWDATITGDIYCEQPTGWGSATAGYRNNVIQPRLLPPP